MANEDRESAAATMVEKVGALDRTIGHLLSTAQLGLGFVATVVSIVGILIAIFLALQTFMLTEVISTGSKLEKQQAIMERQSTTIAGLQSQFDTLNAALGDAPDKLKSAALSIKDSQEQMTLIFPGLKRSADKIQGVAGDFVQIQRALFDIRDPKGEFGSKMFRMSDDMADLKSFLGVK